MPKQTIDYSTGKIYKIISSTSNYVYIGSTTNTLSTRFSLHKSQYKSGKNKNLSMIFDNNNIDNCYIELIKNYPCSCRNELEREEGIEIRKINNDTSTKEICLNYNIAGRTQKEYNQDNKEKINKIRKQWYENNKETINEKQKQYYEDNKETIVETKKQWYENNKEIILEKQKQYYENNKEKKKQWYDDNKEKILENQKQYYNNYKEEKYTCECGKTSTITLKLRHEKSKKHQSFINSQTPEQTL